MGICLSLSEINELYHHFFLQTVPEHTSFEEDMKRLVHDIGPDRIRKRLKEMKEVDDV